MNTQVKKLMEIGYTRDEAEDSVACDMVDARQQDS